MSTAEIGRGSIVFCRVNKSEQDWKSSHWLSCESYHFIVNSKMEWFSTNISPQSLLRIPQGDSSLIRSDLFCIGMTPLCANRLCVFSRQKRSSRKLRKCLKSSTLTYKKNYHRCGQGKHASAPVCTSHL